MAPRRVAVLLLLPLLAASIAGCAAFNDVQRFIDRAQGKVEYAQVDRLNEAVAFTPNDPPSAPPAVGKVTTLNFTVGPGATTLRVDVAATVDGPLPVVPVPLPRSRVTVLLLDPSGTASGNATFTDTGAEGFDKANPASGVWGVRLETLGQGSVRVVAVSTEPVK